MARSTPTYTPIRNYAICFFLSTFLLFSDISYGSFSQVRGVSKATSLYVRMISGSLLEIIGDTYSSFKEHMVLSGIEIKRARLSDITMKRTFSDIRTENIISGIMRISGKHGCTAVRLPL